jgi:hypothetical protein
VTSQRPENMTWTNRAIFILAVAAIVLTTIAYGGVHQPVISAFYLIVAAMALLWIANALRSGTVRISRSMLPVTLFLAGGYGLLQSFSVGNISDPAGLSGVHWSISIEPFTTQVWALHFIWLGVYFALLLTSIDRFSRLKAILFSIIFFGFVYAFYAILQGILSPRSIYGIYEAASPYGSFVNRHNFAAFMELVLAIPIAMLATGQIKNDQRLLYIAAIIIMGVALLLSGSRGGLVAVTAEILIILLLASGNRGRRDIVIKFSFAAALLATMVAGAFFVGGETSISRVADSADSRDVSSDRFHIWAGAVRVAAEHLPLGSGLGTFGVAYTEFDTANGLERVEQAHNDFLQVVTDAGIPGILIGSYFLFLFGSELRRNVRNQDPFKRSVAIGAGAGCIAVLVHSLFDFVLHTTAISVMFLSVLSLLAASGRAFSDEKSRRKLAGKRSGGSAGGESSDEAISTSA